MSTQKPSPEKAKEATKSTKPPEEPKAELEREIGGYKDSGLKEPTRYGDWEVKGRCSDF
jgi:hypothetical protein